MRQVLPRQPEPPQPGKHAPALPGRFALRTCARSCRSPRHRPGSRRLPSSFRRRPEFRALFYVIPAKAGIQDARRWKWHATGFRIAATASSGMTHGIVAGSKSHLGGDDFHRHSGEGRNPERSSMSFRRRPELRALFYVIPANAGIQNARRWNLACHWIPHRRYRVVRNDARNSGGVQIAPWRG